MRRAGTRKGNRVKRNDHRNIHGRRHRGIALLGLVSLLLGFAIVSDSVDADAGEGYAGIPLSDQIASSSDRLDGLRARIHDHRAVLDSLSLEQSGARRNLSALAKEIGLVKTLLVGLENREKMLTQQSDSLRLSLERRRLKLAAGQDKLAQRLRSIYTQGSHQQLELILTAESFSALVSRLKFNTILARLDGRLVADMRHQAQQIELEQKQLQAGLVDIWQSREEATQEGGRLELIEAERIALLRRIESDQLSAEGRLRELRRSEEQLVAVLAELEERRQAQLQTRAEAQAEARTQVGSASGGDLSTLAGSLEWPVAGEVIRGYGRSVHPEFKTVTLNNGINIAAPAGTPVFAVAAGTVEFAADLPGFGLCIILDHDAGYYTLYANLARVFVLRGSHLGRGEILAEIGESLDSHRPQLYFEIRRGRTPLDPTEWLRPRR